MVSLFSFLVVIGICVVSHEMGHYLMARWRGVQVHEFSFGMGPALWSRRKGETLWAVRALPIGGFVRLEGMEGAEDVPNETDTPDPSRSFPVKKPWERFVILAGGAFFNIILAWFLTAALLMFYGVMDFKTPVVGNVMPGYPAQQMGLQQGDRILSVGGMAVTEWGDIRKNLQLMKTEKVTIKLDRAGETLVFNATIPFSKKDNARLLGIQPARVQYGFIGAFSHALTYCWQMSVEILKGFWMLITGTQKGDMAGPVGIAVMAGDAAKQGFWTFISFLAVINLNLGLLNLFPFPALDGGRIIFVTGEMISGKKFPEVWENRIHYAGFMLLLALIAMVTWKDLQRLFKL